LFVLAVSLVYAVIQRTWWLILGRVPSLGVGRSVVVLTYHSVSEEDAERFREQMGVLVSLAKTVFADVLSDSRDGDAVASVTFDDGFQDVFDQALPIMAEYGVPATVFVPSAFIGTVPGWIPVGRRRAGSSGVVVAASTLAAADRRLVQVGSHTVTHSHLNSLPCSNVERELADSKRLLEEITRGWVTMLSFPYGSFDERVIEAAGAAGYTHLFANVPIRARKVGSTRLIGRVNTSPRDWRLEFQLKVLGAYEWLALAIPAKRAILRWFKGKSVL
jgi:peptidoglycan/xylan/chitin deacetylase (PgdA/CDA1 family)